MQEEEPGVVVSRAQLPVVAIAVAAAYEPDQERKQALLDAVRTARLKVEPPYLHMSAYAARSLAQRVLRNPVPYFWRAADMWIRAVGATHAGQNVLRTALDHPETQQRSGRSGQQTLRGAQVDAVLETRRSTYWQRHWNDHDTVPVVTPELAKRLVMVGRTTAIQVANVRLPVVAITAPVSESPVEERALVAARTVTDWMKGETGKQLWIDATIATFSTGFPQERAMERLAIGLRKRHDVNVQQAEYLAQRVVEQMATGAIDALGTVARTTIDHLSTTRIGSNVLISVERAFQVLERGLNRPPLDEAALERTREGVIHAMGWLGEDENAEQFEAFDPVVFEVFLAADRSKSLAETGTFTSGFTRAAEGAKYAETASPHVGALD